MNPGMKRTVLAGILLLATAAVAGAETVLYVAPNGNDAWSGALDAPNAEGADGPLATWAAARDAIRARKAEGPLKEPVTVRIRGGVYYVTEPLVFTPEDSGTQDAPITYAAYPGETPLLHGGRVLEGFQANGDTWVLDIPEVKNGDWSFSALWIDGERRTRARTPNATNEAGDYPTEDDFFYADGPVTVEGPDGKKQSSSTAFRFRDEDIKPWDSLDESVFIIFHSWATSLLRPKSLDTENRFIEFTGPARWPFCRWRENQWYFVENLLEGLDQPGEWHLSRKTGRLTYMPMPGETPESVEAVAPVAKQLILLEGNPAAGKFVGHLHFEGLHLACTEFGIAPEGHSDAQAAFAVPAAFEATGARHCRIDRCRIAHVGTYGVWWRAGSQDNTMTRTECVDLGAGGVRIGEGTSPATVQEATLRNIIDNNFLHDGGRMFRSAVGVWIGRSSYNRVSHNDVCDFRYSGMSVGWSWGYQPSSAHHNVIEFNHIHNVGKGQLSDMGGIYTLGVSPGTVLRNNYIHDVLSNPDVSGGWGLYTDEGSSEILMENNVVHHTRTGTFHQHYGRENVLRNNILAFSEREQIIRSREEEHISFSLENNIIYYSNGRLLGSHWANGNYRFDRNCYWDTSDMPLEFAGHTFEEWRAKGYDAHSIIADPLFHDIENRDFRLKPDSPALELGFRPIDVSKSGLYGEAEWVGKPKQIPRRPFTPPQPPEPVTVAEDFEQVDVGAHPPGCRLQGETGGASIRVTGETAATGSRSLRFTDAAGLEHSFAPYLYYEPHLRAGVAHGRFDIRPGKGATFYHEWRDSHSPYRAGPSLWFDGEGNLSVRGQQLMQLPLDTWVTVEVRCPLGKQANGKYALTVTVSGQDPRSFEDLPCTSPAFKRIDWFGFVSNTDGPAITHIDNISLESK